MKLNQPVLHSAGLPLTERDTFGVDLETASGSRYRITWDSDARAGTLARRTADDREKQPMSDPLRRDGETVPLLGFDRIDLDHPTTFVIDVRRDGVLTHRWANAAVRIEGLGLRSGGEPINNPTAAVDDGLVRVANGVLGNVHQPSACADDPWGCWIHRPFPHPLDQAPVRWRDDEGVPERICEHRRGHPDPQDAAYWWNTQRRDITHHDCDGCCTPNQPDWARGLLPDGRCT